MSLKISEKSLFYKFQNTQQRTNLQEVARKFNSEGRRNRLSHVPSGNCF